MNSLKKIKKIANFNYKKETGMDELLTFRAIKEGVTRLHGTSLDCENIESRERKQHTCECGGGVSCILLEGDKTFAIHVCERAGCTKSDDNAEIVGAPVTCPICRRKYE